jgi:hypothetical protein
MIPTHETSDSQVKTLKQRKEAMIERVTTRAAAGLAVISVFLCVVPLRAHHSISMFDISTAVWVKGTVVRVDRINPHSMIVLEKRSPDGQAQRWTVEGPNVSGLTRRGLDTDFLKAGDLVEVCGFALKKDVSAARSSSELYASPQFVHGHLLVLPGGHMKIWGSYGKLENCVRPDDKVSTWLEFVNTDGRTAWCGSRSFVNIPSKAPKTLVDAIDRGLTSPCEPNPSGQLLR